MIHVLSLHPSFDKHLSVQNFVAGGTHICRIEGIRAAGKGLNVSRTITQMGGASVLWLLLGSENGAEYMQKAEVRGIEIRSFEVPGRVRENLKIHDSTSGETTELNGVGAELSEAVAGEIMRQLLESLVADDILVLSGSMPAGVAVSWLKELVMKAKGKGCFVIADTSGKALETVLEARVSLIKPNRDELVELLKLPVDLTHAELMQIAKQKIDGSWPIVILSMGEAGVAFFANNAVVQAQCKADKVLNTTGAGDALVGAVAVGLQTEELNVELLKRAVATACLFVEKNPGNELSLGEIITKEGLVEISIF